MVFSGVPKEKDLLGGPTNPSPHVGGALAPNDWGLRVLPLLSHDPLRVGQPHQINPGMGCPTHKGSNGGGGAGFDPLVIVSTSLD